MRGCIRNFDKTFQKRLNVTRLRDLFKPLSLPPSNFLRFANLVVWKLGIDRGRGLIDLTPLVASTAPSLITNPLLIAFKWDDVPWMAAFRFVRKKEKEEEEVEVEEEVSTPRVGRETKSLPRTSRPFLHHRNRCRVICHRAALLQVSSARFSRSMLPFERKEKDRERERESSLIASGSRGARIRYRR